MAKPRPQSSISTVIMDFDGVIADSREVFLEVLQTVLKRPKPFTDKEVEEMRALGTRQVVKYVGLKTWQIPATLSKGRRLILEKMDQVALYDGMDKAIHDLFENGYAIYILSTNTDTAIKGFLSKYGLQGYIRRVYHGTSLFGKAKALNRLIKKESLDKSECLYIGDETRDIDAAKELGIYSLAVQWGYNDAPALEGRHPDALIKTPPELSSEIKSKWPFLGLKT